MATPSTDHRWESRLLKRLAWLPACFCASIVVFPNTGAAVQRDARVEALEILRTDPATVRTPSGQWMLARDDARLDDFHATFGNAWRVRWNELTRTQHRAWGGSIPAARIDAALEPRGPRDKEAVLRLSEAFVRAQADLLGVRWEELEPLFVGFKGGRWVVTLGQRSQGLEVVGGRVDLRFSARGDLMLFGSDIYRAPSLKALPHISAASATLAAQRGLPDAIAASGDAELVFLPIMADEPRRQGARKTAPRDDVKPEDVRVRVAYLLSTPFHKYSDV